MKKGIFIGLALVLVLAAFMPAPALAAKPGYFGASGTVLYITPGDVKPAGDSGRYVVITRQLGGILSGSIGGFFTMDYKANVELATQAGNLHGTLQVGAYTLNVNGKLQPLVFVGPSAYGTCIEACTGFPVFKSTVDGNWNFLVGSQGAGNFASDIFLIINPNPASPNYGHVVGFECSSVSCSSVTLTGQWQP